MYKFETENITPRLQEIRAKRANIISIVAIGIAIASFVVSAITLNNHYKDQGGPFYFGGEHDTFKNESIKDSPKYCIRSRNGWDYNVHNWINNNNSKEVMVWIQNIY